MAITTDDILSILRDHGIDPDEATDFDDLPEVGEIEEGETVYTTSIKAIFPSDDERGLEEEGLDFEDDHIAEWWRRIEGIIEGQQSAGTPVGGTPWKAPDPPHCAWYCPIHYFGDSWGIFIRDSCIRLTAIEIARAVDWRLVDPKLLSRPNLLKLHLYRSAFYVFFLHEQFHHKVESLGLRLLVATGSDRYRPYKSKVYRPALRKNWCIEESLANADSYIRLDEPRYKKRHDPAILAGLQKFLKVSFAAQPPGYKEALNFLEASTNRAGRHKLQSQILEGSLSPATPASHWFIAPSLIRALKGIRADIYVIVPTGALPIFSPTTIDPGATTTSRSLAAALQKFHGYQQSRGGKGSHVKLIKDGAPNIHIPGNRPVVSRGVVKQALAAIGGYPLSRLPDLLAGNLR